MLALLGFVLRSDQAGQQSGVCPLHGSTQGTARCFGVNTQSHTFHCFKCGRSGNALDLSSAAHRLSIDDAALELCQHPVVGVDVGGKRQQRRGKRSQRIKQLYNPLSVSRDAIFTR